MSNSIFTLESVLPIEQIQDGVILSADGCVTLGWELTLPVVGTASDAVYRDMITNLKNAIMVLPEWTLVHRQDVFTRDRWSSERESASFLGRCSDAYFSEMEHMTCRQYVFLTRNMVKPSQASLLKSHSGSSVFGKHIILSSADREKITQGIQDFEVTCNDFIGILSRGSVQARRLSTDELAGDGVSSPGLVQRHLMLGEKDMVMSHPSVSESYVDVLGKRMISCTVSSAAQMPGEVDACVTVGSLSSEGLPVYYSYASPIGILLNYEHVVNNYFIVPNQQSVVSIIETRQGRMQAMATYGSNSTGAEDLLSFSKKVEREKLFLIYAHTNVCAWCEKGGEAEMRGALLNGMKVMGCQTVINDLDTPVIYIGGVPGGGVELGEVNYRLSEITGALCMVPSERFEEGMKHKLVRFTERLTGVPIGFDTQKAAQKLGLVNGYNGFVLGTTGSGKSYFMNNYVRHLYDAGQSVFIIDVGDSYEVQCQLVKEESGGRDGKYYTWDTNNPISFDLFTNWREWVNEEGIFVMTPDSDFFIVIMQTIWVPNDGGWLAERTEVLRSTVSDFVAYWKKEHGAETPILDNYYNYIADVVAPAIEKGEYRCGKLEVGSHLFDANKFCTALVGYSKQGTFSFLFNNPHPEDILSNRFTVFEVKALSDVDQNGPFYSICICCIMHVFDDKMRSDDGVFKTLIIEEAWKAIANQTMSGIITSIWKTSRKYSASAFVVTQQIRDIQSSSIIKDTIIANSDIRVFLGKNINRTTIDQAATLFSFNETVKSLMGSLNRANDPRRRYKEALLSYAGGYNAVVRVECSPQEGKVFESNKREKEPLLTLANKYSGSFIRAVKELTQMQ